MPLTKLDTTCALIVIDLQKGIAGLPVIHPINEIIGRAAQLARAFREQGLPVVLVNVSGRAPGRTDAGNPSFRFQTVGPSLFPNWSSSLVITSLPSNGGARSLAQLWMIICASAG